MPDVQDKYIKRLHSLLQESETSLAAAKELLASLLGDDFGETVPRSKTDEPVEGSIEGVFDGQNMVGSNSKTYPVQANYASKSKLVQGDAMRLVIGEDGSFTYKPLNRVARVQVVGTLMQKNGQYFVKVGDKQYRVLLASVTYLKAVAGDQITVKIPEEDPDAEWAAIEAAL